MYIRIALDVVKLPVEIFGLLDSRIFSSSLCPVSVLYHVYNSTLNLAKSAELNHTGGPR